MKIKLLGTFAFNCLLAIIIFGCSSSNNQNSKQLSIDKLIDKVWYIDEPYRNDMLKFTKDFKLINLNKKGIATYKLEGDKLIFTSDRNAIESYKIDTITDNEFIISDINKISNNKSKFKLATISDIIVGDWISQEGAKEVTFEFKKENKLSIRIDLETKESSYLISDNNIKIDGVIFKFTLSSDYNKLELKTEKDFYQLKRDL